MRQPIGIYAGQITARETHETARNRHWLVHTEEVTGSIPVSPAEERPGQKLTASRRTRPFVMIELVAGAFPEQSPRRSLAVHSPGPPACSRCSARTTSPSQPPRPPTVKGPLGVSGSRGRSGADGDLEPGEEIGGRVLSG